MTSASKYFEKWLRSIGGLESGTALVPTKNTHRYRYYCFQFVKKLGINDEKNLFRNKITTRDFFHVMDGWLPIVKSCLEHCIEVGWNKQITSCKQHHGVLQIHTTDSSIKVLKVLKLYENISATMCEDCGSKEGVTTDRFLNNKWIHTFCVDCKAKPRSVDAKTSKVARKIAEIKTNKQKQQEANSLPSRYKAE